MPGQQENIEKERLFTAFAYCGKIDRLLYKYRSDIEPSENMLHMNAGLSLDNTRGDRDTMIAQGTFEWLRDFHLAPDSFSLSNTSIRAMHRKIFKYSPRDASSRGLYRTDLDNEMKKLFDSTKEGLLNELRHPLITISRFRIHFIDTMPFISGNTNSANLISYALLVKSGYGFVSGLPLLSLLNNAVGGFSQASVEFLPHILYLAITENSQSRDNASLTYLNSRKKALVALIDKSAPIKISDIMEKLPGENRNTIKKDIIYLRKNGLITANGAGRGMFYTTKNK